MATPYNKTSHLRTGSRAGLLLLRGLAAALSAQTEHMQANLLEPSNPRHAQQGLTAADMSALAGVQALERAQSEQAAMRQLGNALAGQGHTRAMQGEAPALDGQWTAQQPVRLQPEHPALVVTALFWAQPVQDG